MANERLPFFLALVNLQYDKTHLTDFISRLVTGSKKEYQFLIKATFNNLRCSKESIRGRVCLTWGSDKKDYVLYKVRIDVWKK